MAAYLKSHLTLEHDLKVTVISLDDFYLSKAGRLTLSKNIHPLLKTPGVPGTHKIDRALAVLQDLRGGHAPIKIPHFNKSQDDVMPEDQWDIIEQPQDIIIFEGWCLGAEPQDPKQLLPPTNELEFNEDKQGIWRNYINEQLQGKYRELFSMIDIWAMLTVSDFNTVFVWRLE